MAPSKRSVRKCARVLPPIDHHLAVHDDVVDADRVMLRVLACGMGLHRIGIEDDDISLESIAEKPSVGKSQSLLDLTTPDRAANLLNQPELAFATPEERIAVDL